MSVKLINKETIKDIRLKNNHASVVQVYAGDRKNNVAVGDKVLVPMKNANYADSEGKMKLWNEMSDLVKKINAAQVPAQADIEALVGKMYIDMTRRAQEAGDLTSFFATEISDPEAPEVITTKYIYKYIGLMEEVTGSNDSVNLIEQKLGDTDTFPTVITALGWKDSLANMLWNKIHSMEKVNEAAIDADTDKRNSKTVGMIVGATFVTSQKQAADSTSGATFDNLTYNTIRKAIKKLRALKDPRTGRPIAANAISLLCNSANTWDLQRVLAGQLTGNPGGTITTQNAQALPIQNIIEYDQGITNGFTYGKKTLAYPGVTAGKCYIFIPREYLWVVNKRGLTLEAGTGSVLQLSTEEKAWYRVDGIFTKDFLGSSYPGTALGAGYGAIIEVTLPTDA